jgi:hypothetical protein
MLNPAPHQKYQTMSLNLLIALQYIIHRTVEIMLMVQYLQFLDLHHQELDLQLPYSHENSVVMDYFASLEILGSVLVLYQKSLYVK